jgi:hypothetical protein
MVGFVCLFAVRFSALAIAAFSPIYLGINKILNPY